MSLRDVFARNLRRIRQGKGLSQEQLAADADISREYLGALERSAYSASIDVIENLALALTVDPAELLQKGTAAGKAGSRPSR